MIPRLVWTTRRNDEFVFSQLGVKTRSSHVLETVEWLIIEENTVITDSEDVDCRHGHELCRTEPTLIQTCRPD